MNDFVAHILVVDDDEGIRSLIKQYLKRGMSNYLAIIDGGVKWLELLFFAYERGLLLSTRLCITMVSVACIFVFPWAPGRPCT